MRLLGDGLPPQHAAHAVAQFTALIENVAEAAYRSRNVQSAFEVGAAPPPVMPKFADADVHALLKLARWPESNDFDDIVEAESDALVKAFRD